MINYHATKRFNIEVGPSISSLLTSDVVGYERYDYGVAGGARLYTNTNARFALFARYYYGLAKIATQADDIVGSPLSW
jgi:hypothetical protein